MSRTDARSSSLRRRPSRTLPAVIVAVMLLAAGVTLVWATVDRLANGRWPAWVGASHQWAAAQTWGSPSTITISVLVALLGLLLLVVALTPGQLTGYRIEPAETADRTSPSNTEVAMSRRAVAELATAQANLVDGVDAASAVATGRAVKLRVNTPSAHRPDVERAVTERVRSALSAAGLAPMPTVTASVQSRRP